MISGLPKRIAALVAATLFLLTTAGEGFGLHPCPYHDSLAGAMGHEHAAGAMAHHHAAAGHLDHHHQGSSHNPSDSNDQQSTPCTHTDACQPPAGAVAPLGLDAILVAIYLTPDAGIRPATEWLAPSVIPHFLPYSQAPPALG